VGPGIPSPGQNWLYGIETGNSNDHPQSGAHIAIVGNTIYGVGGGAVKLYAANYVHVEGNEIYLPTTVYGGSILVGPRVGTNTTACNNELANNKISYFGGSSVAAVAEDAQYTAFTSACVNRVHDNVLHGNLSEFSKNVLSSSINYGTKTTTSGPCTGTLACTNTSQIVHSIAQAGSTAVLTITTQAEVQSGNTLYRWYGPSGGLMGTISTDGSFRLGDGTIGSLWAGGNLAMDVNRNIFAGSVTVGGSLAIDGSRNAVLNSITSVIGSVQRLDNVGNTFFNSVTINGTLTIDNARNVFASALYNGGVQSIDSARNASFASVTVASVVAIDSARDTHFHSISIGSGAGTLTIDNFRNATFNGVNAALGGGSSGRAVCIDGSNNFYKSTTGSCP
jgi:hypothetical protein